MNEIHKRVTEVIRSGLKLDMQPDIIAYKAIAAMRDPTQAMIDAPAWWIELHNDDAVISTWQAMIDAALK